VQDRDYVAVIRQDIRRPHRGRLLAQHRVCVVTAVSYSSALDKILSFTEDDDEIVAIGVIDYVIWPPEWRALTDNLIVEPVSGQSAIC